MRIKRYKVPAGGKTGEFSKSTPSRLFQNNTGPFGSLKTKPQVAGKRRQMA